MNVQIEKSFPLPASADTTWRLMQDMQAVASCMPGASITERVDASHYKGVVAVRFGPASMSFRGALEVKSIDPANHTLRLVGKGTDATGSSATSMDLTTRIEAVDATSCKLVGNSNVSISGKAAAFGGRMMNAVADQVLNQFAGNFAAKLQAMQPPATPRGAGGANDQSGPGTDAAPVPAQLNALALAWAAIKDWLRSLLLPKKT